MVNLLFDRLENRKRSVWRVGKAATEGIVRLLRKLFEPGWCGDPVPSFANMQLQNNRILTAITV